MAPFKSKSQMRYLYSQKPEIAKEFADKTTDYKKLPKHVKQLKAIKEKTKGK